jgi:hypothetical protein
MRRARENVYESACENVCKNAHDSVSANVSDDVFMIFLCSNYRTIARTIQSVGSESDAFRRLCGSGRSPKSI